MLNYEIPVEKHATFMTNLNRQITRDPLDVTYPCDIKVNNELYRLRLQVCPHRRLNPIQAIRLNKDITKCELITDPAILEALTNLIVAQYGEK